MNVALANPSKFGLPVSSQRQQSAHIIIYAGKYEGGEGSGKETRTDVAHGVVGGVRVRRVEREREEAAVRALAPLEVSVDADELLRDDVRRGRRNPRTK